MSTGRPGGLTAMAVMNFLFGGYVHRQLIAGFSGQRCALARIGCTDRGVKALFQHPVLVGQKLDGVHGKLANRLAADRAPSIWNARQPRTAANRLLDAERSRGGGFVAHRSLSVQSVRPP